MKTPTHNPPVEVDEEERTLGALLAPDMLVMLEESPDAIAAETDELHAKDLADVAQALPREMVAPFLSALPVERAADLLEYLNEDLRSEAREFQNAHIAATNGAAGNAHKQTARMRCGANSRPRLR
ncbi:MAG TPA: hypothetical protein VN876_09550 [Gemmatimonadaceae bacterium]|nr:hypothetical protein [Gemmatimonadaceae bacterium]